MTRPAPEFILLAVHRCAWALDRGPLLADVVGGLALESLGPQHVLIGVRVRGVEGVVLPTMARGRHCDSSITRSQV